MQWTRRNSAAISTSAAIIGLILIRNTFANEYEMEVAKDHPVAWWRFQQSTSEENTTVADSREKHAGTIHGRVAIESGPPAIGGKSARFDGSSAFVEIPGHADFELAGISVELWFNSTQPWLHTQWPGSATLITKATENGSSGDWTVNGASTRAGENEGRVVVSCGPTGGSSDTNTVTRAGLNDGRWHHLVWTRSEDGINQLFVDGQMVDENEDAGGSIVNHRTIQIGGDPHQKGRFFNGLIAEAAIYDTPLSPDRVIAHARAGGIDVSAGTAEIPPVKQLESMKLTAGSEIDWELMRTDTGWTLGSIIFRGKPLETPANAGVLCLRGAKNGQVRWLAADKAERIDASTARLSGKADIDGAILQFTSEIALKEGMPAAQWTTDFSVDRELKDWEVCLAPWGRSATDWRCWCYPFAGNSKNVTIDPLRYCGVPAAVVYRPDLSAVTLFGIDATSDYLNPNTWTGRTAFHFKSRTTPPEFRFGGGRLSPGEKYRVPLQLIVGSEDERHLAIAPLVRAWTKLNDYHVEPLKVCEPDKAVSVFVEGRRASQMWQPGRGYQIQDAWPVIYMPESPINAYLDYLLYERTGDSMWRDRAIQIMEFLKGAQHNDPAEPQYGAIESHFNLREGQFASTDRGGNPGLKPDMNAYAARYTLLLWQRIKQREGEDRQDWYEMGTRMADWVVRQQRPDGGFPQVVGPDSSRNAISVVSGRVLVALPVVRRITGNQRLDPHIERHENFLRQQVEQRLWYTGAHTDLPPRDFESDSVWQVVEFWLDKFESTRTPDCLDHAEANALLAFLMMCPKQLSWVANPTQTCHAEQQHYLQYSNYCYTNAKIACLHRLAKLTGQELYRQLCDRIIQCGCWCQETSGPWKGSVYERMSDPWLGVSQDCNSKGTRYMSELAVEFNLQLLETGIARLGSQSQFPAK